MGDEVESVGAEALKSLLQDSVVLLGCAGEKAGIFATELDGAVYFAGILRGK